MSDSYFLQLHVQQINLLKKYSCFILVFQNDKFNLITTFTDCHISTFHILCLPLNSVDDPLLELPRTQHWDLKMSFYQKHTYLERAYKNSTMIARHGSYLGQIYLNCKHVISYQSTKDPSAASLLSQDIGQTPWRYSSVFTLHHLGCVILGTLAQSSSLSNSMKSTNKYML